MKKILLIVLFTVLLIIITAVFWFLSSQNKPKEIMPVLTPTQNTKPITATLEIFTGNVSVMLPGTNKPQEAISGEAIAEGTRVITGEISRAQLLFPNKSVTRLDDKTEITLKKLSANPLQIEVVLEKRRIWNRVAKLFGNESFQTVTPTVIATVRGTSFGHGILPDGRNRIISRRGTIETKCINESQNAEVIPNKKILLDCSAGGKLPLLELDEEIKDKDEWYEYNIKQDNELDSRFGMDIYKDAVN